MEDKFLAGTAIITQKELDDFRKLQDQCNLFEARLHELKDQVKREAYVKNQADANFRQLEIELKNANDKIKQLDQNFAKYPPRFRELQDDFVRYIELVYKRNIFQRSFSSSIKDGDMHLLREVNRRSFY